MKRLCRNRNSRGTNHFNENKISKRALKMQREQEIMFTFKREAFPIHYGLSLNLYEGGVEGGAC